MSYTLMAYSVDISQLLKAVGSKDDSLLKAVMDHSEEFDDDDEEEEDDDDDELSLATALRQLIMGQPLDPEEAHQYGYALLELCDYLGERQECDAWSGVRWEAVEACGLEQVLTKTGPPVEIPPNDDFPRVGHLPRSAIKSFQGTTNSLSENASDPGLQELLEELSDWLESAASKNRDLVFFYH